MNHTNLRKALEANRFYYNRIAEATPAEPEHLRIKQKRILTTISAEIAVMEARLRALEAKFSHKYNRAEPRIPAGNGESGEWTNEGGNAEGVTAADRKNPRFKSMTDTQIKKQKFVDAHLAATEKGARQLNVPVENVLGLSALESGWGITKFPTIGNNFFGQHSPGPYEIDSFPVTKDTTVRGSIFNSYEDSLQSFIKTRGHLIQGISDPAEFTKDCRIQVLMALIKQM